MAATKEKGIILTGHRPTGPRHIGHLVGTLEQWAKMQDDYTCYFLIADLHVLTTDYAHPERIQQNITSVVTDWLASGLDPERSIFVRQSAIMEHAQLALLFGMLTTVARLERVPTFKEQIQQLKLKPSAGLLTYPVLQSADILIYKADTVPVGEDQLPHIELTREIARRFNHFYGSEPDFETKVNAAIRKMGKKNARLYQNARKRYREQGDTEALSIGRALLDSQQNISLSDRERLLGYLDGEGRIILPEPQSLLTVSPRMPGIDGQKMSKSYNNTIALREPVDGIRKKIQTMPTDPARVRRTDPGDPAKCPVWGLHQVYTDDDTQKKLSQGCKTAAIGCLDCKQYIIDAMIEELKPIQQRIKEYLDDLSGVDAIINEGCEAARDVATDTIEEVRKVMGLTGRK